MIVTTTPWFEELAPTASQVVAPEGAGHPVEVTGARDHLGGGAGLGNDAKSTGPRHGGDENWKHEPTDSRGHG